MHWKYKGTTSSWEACQEACQLNTATFCEQCDNKCDFFVWGGPNSWWPNGCWLKQFKDEQFDDLTRITLNGAVSGLFNCGLGNYIELVSNSVII